MHDPHILITQTGFKQVREIDENADQNKIYRIKNNMYIKKLSEKNLSLNLESMKGKGK